MLLDILFVAILCSILTKADYNVTLDDSNPAIVYEGDWMNTLPDPLNAGGSHKVSVTDTANASLTFTGANTA